MIEIVLASLGFAALMGAFYLAIRAEDRAWRPSSWLPPQSIPMRVVCVDCDGPRLVRSDGSCYTCGSASTLRHRGHRP